MSGSDPAPGTGLHASVAVVGEVGVLVRGPSGAGKTRLVLALVEAARRDGRFARLVADDRTLVTVYGDRLVGRPHPAIAGRAERRGLGILTVDHEPACVLGLVVDLAIDPVPRIPEASARRARIAGVTLPRLSLPANGAANDAASLVLTTLAALGHGGQALAPFSLPRPPRCTR